MCINWEIREFGMFKRPQICKKRDEGFDVQLRKVIFKSSEELCFSYRQEEPID